VNPVPRIDSAGQAPASAARYEVTIEATQPLQPLTTPPGTERVRCMVLYNREALGDFELPVFNDFLSCYVLEDAIAAEFSWAILGGYLRHAVYESLDLAVEDGVRIWRRDGLVVATGVPDRDDPAFHDSIGWAVLLQELWNRPAWAVERFYGPNRSEPNTAPLQCEDSTIVEVCEELHELACSSHEIELIATVGGAALGVLRIPVEAGRVSVDSLICAITTFGGLELCRVVVRQALIGRPLAGPTLRERLAESSDRLRSLPEIIPATPETIPATNDASILPVGRAAVSDAVPSGSSCLLVPRHRNAVGTSASRRAHLPSTVMQEVIQCAEVEQSPLVMVGADVFSPNVVYAPDLLLRRAREHMSTVPSNIRTSPTIVADEPYFGRGYWEGLFARVPDPWRYGNRYEQVKYEQTLSLVPAGIDSAMEVACAEGFFTEKLAPQVQRLIASDISQVAVERTAQRCAAHSNIEYMRVDLARDELPTGFDLIVCSEVLYFMGDWETLRNVAAKLAGALKPGGYLLTTHANQVVDDPDQPGFDWGLPYGARGIADILGTTAGLQLQMEIKTPLYRIQLYRKGDGVVKQPEIVEGELPHPLPENIATMVRCGNERQRVPVVSTRTVTRRLPILTYHRVAPTGSDSLALYRVHPDNFEQQIQYLRDAGYYSSTFEQWRIAGETRQPLPGRAVILTFDDGYRDFHQHAWPVLKRHGFSAVVFVVTSQIGGINQWDSAQEELELLGEQEIRSLDREGVEFGSHSHDHRSMLTLSPEEVAREHLASRAALGRILGRAVDKVSYPYGASDRVVQHLAGACGYVYGVSTRVAASRLQDSLLALPRIEISGQDGLEQFIAKLTNED
jgi:peptidoglycan/xylan/chitin deacetylase (PgdA/CDA1 family)